MRPVRLARPCADLPVGLSRAPASGSSRGSAAPAAASLPLRVIGSARRRCRPPSRRARRDARRFARPRPCRTMIGVSGSSLMSSPDVSAAAHSGSTCVRCLFGRRRCRRRPASIVGAGVGFLPGQPVVEVLAGSLLLAGRAEAVAPPPVPRPAPRRGPAAWPRGRRRAATPGSRRGGRSARSRSGPPKDVQSCLHRYPQTTVSKPPADARQPQAARRTVFRMDRRIFGMENEYGVTCTFRGQRRLSPDEVARYLFRRVVSWGRSSNVFLRNGARLYLDVGSHPEYATPECDDVRRPGHPRQGGRADPRGPAGRRRAAAARGGHRRRRLPVQEQHRLGRQLLRLPRELPRRPARRVQPAGRRPDPVPRHPADHLRRRQGAADPARRGLLREPARRAHLGGRLVSATTRSRPIINTRDEPHADAERYRRLHVIVGDSNMSETTTLLKVGADRPRAADDRGRRRDARPDAGEPDPGDPRDQPRHHRPAQGAARQRPRGQRAGDPARVPHQGARLRRPPRAATRASSSRCSTCGSAR